MPKPCATEDSSPFYIRDSYRLDSTDILPRHTYARQRREWLPRMSEYLRKRRIRLSENASLLFENAVTVRHQIQEVIYWETANDIAARARLREELGLYRTLLPTPGSLAATLLIDGGSAEAGLQIAQALLSNQSSLGLTIGEVMVPARLADADPDPAEPVKFLRFELSREDRLRILSGAAVSVWLIEGGKRLTQSLCPHAVASITDDINSQARLTLNAKAP